MYKLLSKLVILSVFLWSVACASKKSVGIETPNEVVPPKLIFLNYKISKNANGNKNIEFINKIIADGKLKTNNSNIKHAAIGDLKCLQLDKDFTEITSMTIQNPLSKHIEFLNDSLIFENKKLDLKSAPLSFRMPLHHKTKFIAINEITDSLQNSSTLIITKLD
ncbi:hypothetical protein ACFSKN_00950 [Mariniflexile gromovii]|uniref:Lipoprotein n=1 Tax=Mariniflexile gromovii TaxID=362523 RepID=A0ABS4BTQ3_9FLAO|nr:hypothetical protein [Mariniflexile gromovii]MBP0903445.1 hypothetical protein [Mariniflexile gromovii]